MDPDRMTLWDQARLRLDRDLRDDPALRNAGRAVVAVAERRGVTPQTILAVLHAVLDPQDEDDAEKDR